MSTTPQEHDKAGWLLYHSVGMFPGQQAAMRAALEGFTTSWCRPGLQRWDDGLAARRQVLDLYASLLRAPADAVYAAENVTQAFAQFVGALGRARLTGKRVLIAADCFPSLHYMLTGLAPLLGYTLDTVPVDAAAGYVTDDGYIARWQDDVALAIITLVTSTASKRAGLQRLAAHGRAQGSLIAVDITQAAGIVDVDVSAPPSTSPPPPRSSGSAARPARAWPTSTRRCWTSACNRWCRAGSASPIPSTGIWTNTRWPRRRAASTTARRPSCPMWPRRRDCLGCCRRRRAACARTTRRCRAS